MVNTFRFVRFFTCVCSISFWVLLLLLLSLFLLFEERVGGVGWFGVRHQKRIPDEGGGVGRRRGEVLDYLLLLDGVGTKDDEGYLGGGREGVG